MKYILLIFWFGRFKYKKWECGGIFDKLEMFDKILENGNGGRLMVKFFNFFFFGYLWFFNNMCWDVCDVF